MYRSFSRRGARCVVTPLLCAFAACSDGAPNPAAPDPTSSPAPEPVGSVQVLPAPGVLGVVPSGPPVRLSAVVRDRAGEVMPRPVAWESSDPTALRVAANGELTPLRPGATVRVTATSGGVQASTSVAVVVYHNDFQAQAPGVLTAAQVAAAWNAPQSLQGVAEGRVQVVEGGEAFGSGRSLRLAFPSGGVGPDAGGALWVLRLNRGYTELYASYRFRFGPGFQFVRGGKLPGLAGGRGNTGGVRPNGSDGWSARMMWARSGRLLQYVYHPDQPGAYGQGWALESPHGHLVHARPRRWYRVEQRVVMNTPGGRDGSMQVWLDGVLVMNRQNVRFRDVDSFAIDAFHLVAFFGGNDASWAPRRDEVLYLDDFVISTVRHEAPSGPQDPGDDPVTTALFPGGGGF